MLGNREAVVEGIRHVGSNLHDFMSSHPSGLVLGWFMELIVSFSGQPHIDPLIRLTSSFDAPLLLSVIRYC